jgi:type III secretory pathway component EscS
MSVTTPPAHALGADRPYPPIGWLSSGALGGVVVGGIILASYAPRTAPLPLATALLCVAAVLLTTAGVLLARLREFSWITFRSVFKWALLAYAITSGMIEFAFVHDHTRGASLVLVTLMLVIFALSVPITIAFTVARYADLD